MSANDGNENQSDMCRVVTDVAVTKAVEKCGSEEAVKDVLADMFGFGDDEDKPDCNALVGDGVQPDDINTAHQQRRVAMCLAWDYVKQDDMQFRSAVNKAWAKVRELEDEYSLEV